MSLNKDSSILNESVRNSNVQSRCGDLSFEDFTKNGFKTITESIRHANALPTENDWNFYKLNESFYKIVNNEGDHILRLMNTILRKYEVDANIKNRDLDEKIELVVEANDNILERVATNLDELNGIKKKYIEPVEYQTVSAQLPINGSWNRINKATFTVNSSSLSSSNQKSSFQSIHLLTGKNIIRPQKFFKDKINNSNTPWQPRITEKPNSIKPLAIFLEETDLGEAFCHPYEFELERFTPPSSHLTVSSPVRPTLISKTPLYEITTEDKLNELVEELHKHTELAVDLEHHSYRSFMGITCLMQISTKNADYLIDTLVLRNKLFILNEVFTKPSIVKILHGADYDIQWLQRDLSLYIINMFDTHQAAKQLGYSELSLAYLLNRFCKFVPNKKFQLADWRIRPLPKELQNYAREDTHYLIYIYHILKNELLKQGNGSDNILKSVIQRCTEICKRRYYKPILSEDSHLDFYRKCKRLFDNRQMYALKYLYQWRDKIAREEDESTGYVLPNHMLLQISEMLPREMQGILACCNPIPPMVRSNLLELHQIILHARDQSVEKPIMKEDNRDRGSTQQFSKINIDSPLYCPHDLTKQQEFRDDLPTLLRNNRSNHDVIVPDVFTAININNKLTIEKQKPIFCVFDTSDNSDSEVETEAIKKIQSLNFLGPYERYRLVKPFIQAEENAAAAQSNTNTNEEDRCNEDRIASLHEHFVKVSRVTAQKTSDIKNHTNTVKEESRQNSDKNIEYQTFECDQNSCTGSSKSMAKAMKNKFKKNKHKFSANNLRPGRGENQYDNKKETKSLLLMGGTKKRKRDESEDNISYHSDYNIPENQVHTPVPSHNNLKHNSRKEKKKSIMKKKKLKQQRSFPNMIPDKPSFRSFDYSAVDFRQFQGGATAASSNQHVESKFKRKNKNRIPGFKGTNKYYTFNNQKGKGAT